MIVYEITAHVQKKLIEKFEHYMTCTHVPEVTSAGRFESAEFARISDGNYRVRYLISSRALLDEYMLVNSIPLRRHFARTFPAGVEISREILEVLKTW